MALPEAPRGVRGALSVGRDVVRADGIRGLYRGLGTVMVGIIPARGVYLTTLEAVKAATERVLEREEEDARVRKEEEEEGQGEEEEAALLRSRREGGAGASSSSRSSSSSSLSSFIPRLSEPQKAGAANAVGGAVASLVTQFFTVPVDVVSQRLMIMESSKEGGGNKNAASATSTARRSPRPPPPPARSGLAMARSIIKAEGVSGLYRGFGASVATFVPSSAVWWSAYGFWQRLIWQNLDSGGGGGGRGGGGVAAAATSLASSSSSSSSPVYHSSGEILAVQTASALAAGCTSAVLTTPFDVVKTRLQVSGSESGSGNGGSGSGASATTKTPSAASVVRQLLREDGFRGLFRGLGPRTVSVALWGTCMVNAYEALKRAAATKPRSDE